MGEQLDLVRLLQELTSLGECAWVEFKENVAEPEEIGEYISALANSAALHGRPRGFVVWGVDDRSRALVGTTFRPQEKRVGNEELQNWLVRQVKPPIAFSFRELEQDGRRFAVLEVPAAMHTPVRFKDFEYMRVGSVKKKLRDLPEQERELWARLARTAFEDGVALAGCTSDVVLDGLLHAAYAELARRPFVDSGAVLARFEEERFIRRREDGLFDITNLGAILFARRLEDFPALARKAVRVIVYKGSGRVDSLREQQGRRGYCGGFEGLLSHLASQLPANEHIGQALRKEVRVYPDIAVRELVANALIHQDFAVAGAGPMVEIFDDRIEITNPGTPLIATERFLDAAPKSRNEHLARFMRRIGICEERGSGIDKVITAAEAYQLPAPDFHETSGQTRAVLFAPREFRRMDRNDRVRACYQHAGLQYVQSRVMTNGTLRQRFGISDANMAQASRIIRDTLESKLIKEADPTNTSRKLASYVPYWA